MSFDIAAGDGNIETLFYGAGLKDDSGVQPPAVDKI
jgi:hypothetical protein